MMLQDVAIIEFRWMVQHARFESLTVFEFLFSKKSMAAKGAPSLLDNNTQQVNEEFDHCDPNVNSVNLRHCAHFLAGHDK